MRIITINQDNKIIGVKNVGSDCQINPLDYISELGELGQIRQPDGSITDTEN